MLMFMSCPRHVSLYNWKLHVTYMKLYVRTNKNILKRTYTSKVMLQIVCAVALPISQFAL